MAAALACVSIILPSSSISHRTRRDSLTPHILPAVPEVCTENLGSNVLHGTLPPPANARVAKWKHRLTPTKTRNLAPAKALQHSAFQEALRVQELEYI